jgi:hypothetical protein
MRVSLAHLREPSTSGGWIDFAVFDAKSNNGSNAELLAALTTRARASGLKIDQSALAYVEGGRLIFHGSKSLGRLSFEQRSSTLDARNRAIGQA